MSVDAQTFLAMGREVLASQPFSALLGAELLALRPGHCELAASLRDNLKQQNGFAHGGVISYLADNALTFAGGTAMQVPVVTSEFKINYLRPGLGLQLIARADAVHISKRQAVCRCEVVALQEDGSEKLCALAQGTINRLGEADKA
jgi:uncharacterized protein (TIGR00369 family)